MGNREDLSVAIGNLQLVFSETSSVARDPYNNDGVSRRYRLSPVAEQDTDPPNSVSPFDLRNCYFCNIVMSYRDPLAPLGTAENADC